MNSLPEKNVSDMKNKSIGFWSRLSRQKSGLGNAAMAAATCLLAARMVAQDREITELKESYGVQGREREKIRLVQEEVKNEVKKWVEKEEKMGKWSIWGKWGKSDKQDILERIDVIFEAPKTKETEGDEGGRKYILKEEPEVTKENGAPRSRFLV